jgi:hypothetical protein
MDVKLSAAAIIQGYQDKRGLGKEWGNLRRNYGLEGAAGAGTKVEFSTLRGFLSGCSN